MEILKAYRNDSHPGHHLPSDWLIQDRKDNTLTWQRANRYNLKNNLSQEYTTFVQRRDFYKWIDSEMISKGYKVQWFKIAYFISEMLHKMEVFPFFMLSNRTILSHAHRCSESIFNLAFDDMKKLYELDVILDEKDALQWDKEILKKEQFIWVDKAVDYMDPDTIKKIEHILQGKFLYSLLVPKEIRFYGNLSNNAMRYNYALQILRPYCENKLK